MPEMNAVMRLAKGADAEGILRIYAPYITDTAVSFETSVPSVDVFSSRIEAVAARYPFLVYEIDHEIVGYAYAARHRERAAYLYNVDVSIYVLPRYHGTGVAHGLYSCLFALLGALGYQNAYAAYTEPNDKSRSFHNRFGFAHVGTHHKTGYKLGRWHDVTWLEKMIGAHDENPKEPLTMGELSHERMERLLRAHVKAGVHCKAKD